MRYRKSRIAFRTLQFDGPSDYQSRLRQVTPFAGRCEAEEFLPQTVHDRLPTGDRKRPKRSAVRERLPERICIRVAHRKRQIPVPFDSASGMDNGVGES